jgi:hypothetical protein
MFGVGAVVEKPSHALVTMELSLFQRLVVPPPICSNPVTWWKTHEGQFPNVDFLTKQVLGILGFHFEIERMFNLDSVLKALKHYSLQVQIWTK